LSVTTWDHIGDDRAAETLSGAVRLRWCRARRTCGRRRELRLNNHALESLDAAFDAIVTAIWLAPRER